MDFRNTWPPQLRVPTHKHLERYDENGHRLRGGDAVVTRDGEIWIVWKSISVHGLALLQGTHRREFHLNDASTVKFVTSWKSKRNFRKSNSKGIQKTLNFASRALSDKDSDSDKHDGRNRTKNKKRTQKKKKRGTMVNRFYVRLENAGLSCCWS